jgi:protein SHQ1
VPSLRIQDNNIEIVVLEQSELHFSASPYFLKLNFAPYKIQDDDDDESVMTSTCRAQYHPDNQTIVIALVKKTVVNNSDDDCIHPHDNFWPNLELTARLIQPKEIPKQWLHAVVEDGYGKDTEAWEHEDVEELTRNLQATTLLSSNYDGYGFANMFHNIFTDYARSGLALEMLQLVRAKGNVGNGENEDSALVDPDQTTLQQRRKWRLEQESIQDFDLERYVQDIELFQNEEDDDEDYMIPLVRDFVPWWKRKTTQSEGDADELAYEFSTKVALHDNAGKQERLNPLADDSNETTLLFTEEERLLMTTIPYPLIPRSLLQSDGIRYKLWCGLLDLLLAYTYDHIMTIGDATVESAWTISILSPSLSWLDSPDTVDEACASFIRRSLCYPYWRSVTFSVRHVMVSTSHLLEAGIPSIVKALLQIRIILERSESYYLGNKLFVDPFLHWIQQQNEKDDVLLQLKEELKLFLKQDEKVIRQWLCLEELTNFHQFMKQQQEAAADSDSDEESSSNSSNDDKSVVAVKKIETNEAGRVMLDDIVGSAEESVETSPTVPSLLRIVS